MLEFPPQLTTALWCYQLQAALVPDAPFDKVLIGRMLGYPDAAITSHVQSKGQTLDAALLAKVDEALAALSDAKPTLPWRTVDAHVAMVAGQMTSVSLLQVTTLSLVSSSVVEINRPSPPHRPREDGIDHPAATSRTNLASVKALLSKQLSKPQPSRRIESLRGEPPISGLHE
jgi:hypothetical protein